MLRILSVIILFSVSSGWALTNKKDSLSKKYDLLVRNGDSYSIIKENVQEDEITGNPYRLTTFIGKQLKSITYFNESGGRANLLDSISQIDFEYKKNQLRMIRLFDRDDKPAEYALFGYSSIQLFYDDQNRIIKEVFRDKSSNPMRYDADSDSQPSSVVFRYENGKVLAREYDENENPISKETEVNPPCIPFAECK